MLRMLRLHELCILLLLVSRMNLAFSWFFNSPKKSEDQLVVVKKSVAFEVKSTDDAFLQQIGDISQLDRCHHYVIAELEETCSGLSEEELGKLAVRLLNCQAEAELRQIFPCTNVMTLAECTKPMDATTWNAYQIVSNRARAVCYATRQQQFRMKTEYTVNKLVATTEEQLEALDVMSKSHEEMIDVTKDTLSRVRVGQEHLLSHQSEMRAQQEVVQTSVSETLRDLHREKALVAAGQQEFAAMADTVKQKLDNATQILVKQETERKENHNDLKDDLSSIRDRANDVLGKIEESSGSLDEMHAHSLRYHDDTLENLRMLNSTLGSLLAAIEGVGESLEQKLNWLLAFVGDTEHALEVVTVLCLHTGYLLLAALSSSFLHTPMTSRVLLLVLVPLNAWAQLTQGTSLGFLAMTVFILLTAMVPVAVRFALGMTRVARRLAQPCVTWYKQTPTLTLPSAQQTRTDNDPMGQSAQSPGRLSQEEYKSLLTILDKLRQSGDIIVQPNDTAEKPHRFSRSLTPTPEKANVDIQLPKFRRSFTPTPEKETNITHSSGKKKKVPTATLR